MDRRSFLKNAALTATAAVPFTAFMQRVGSAQGHPGGVRRGRTAGYGPLFETLDQTTGLPLLALPEGFRYLSFGWAGDLLDNGDPTPGAHDGMAAFAAGSGRVRLVRNHEMGPGLPFSTARYNPAAAGGTVTIEFDTHRGEVLGMSDSLSGTIRNCAGGLTPWGTWLTCEETTLFHAGMPHGYIFEVPADGQGDPTPLKAMGRFSHEAVAVDPATGYVYETEDSGDCGFYRFVPATPGRLRDGGELFAMKVKNVNVANLGGNLAPDAAFAVEWVSVATPDAPGVIPGNFVWLQARANPVPPPVWVGEVKIALTKHEGESSIPGLIEYKLSGEVHADFSQEFHQGRECTHDGHVHIVFMDERTWAAMEFDRFRQRFP